MNSQEAKAPIGMGKYNVQNKIQEAARHSGTSYMASACFCLCLIEMGYYIWYDLQVQGGCFLVR